MARKIELPPNVVSAGYGKRFFAYLIDLIVIALGVVAIYFLFCRNVMLPAVGYEEKVATKDTYLLSTRLTGDRASGWGKLEFATKEGETYGYERYAERIWEYYTVFIPAHEELEFNVPDFTSSRTSAALPTYSGKKDDKDAIGKWTFENFFNGNFTTQTDELGNPDYTKIPVLTEFAKQYLSAVQIQEAFHNPNTGVGSYDDAYEHLLSQTYVTAFDDAIIRCQWLAYIPSVVASPIIFNFIIPLFFPKGKTIGKLFIGTAVVNEVGLKAKRSKIALRYAIITVCYSMLIMQNQTIAIIGTNIMMTLLFITVALSGTGQGIHDIIAGTVVVDEKKSTLFKNLAERDRYIENHPDSPVADWNREKSAEEFMERYGDMDDD